LLFRRPEKLLPEQTRKGKEKSRKFGFRVGKKKQRGFVDEQEGHP